MTALAAIFGPAASEAAVLAMLARMPHRGAAAQVAAGRGFAIGSTSSFAGTSALDAWSPRDPTAPPDALGPAFAAILHDGTLHRDAFGQRPLFYRHDGENLHVATEIGALSPCGPADDAAMTDHLLGALRQLDRTFRSAVRRVRPGHTLRFQNGQITQSRWYHPGTSPVADPVRAVADALDTAVREAAPSPALLQLSGGIDSGALAIRLRHGVLVTARFPGLGCDEGERARQSATAAGLPHFDVDAMRTVPLGADIPDHPWHDPLRPASLGYAELARTHAITTMLSGFGGDELFFEVGVYRDLARHAPLAALREIKNRTYTASSRRDIAWDALAGIIPSRIRALRPTPAPPAWLGPLGRSIPREPSVDAMPGDFTRRATWSWLAGAPTTWAVELLELQAARDGLELRLPYLDSRLADVVLALTWDQRRPNTRMKRLLREASPRLPDAIREAEQITVFDEARRAACLAHRAELSDAIEGPWPIEGLISRRSAAKALSDAADGDAASAELAWTAATLARWRESVVDIGEPG